VRPEGFKLEFLIFIFHFSLFSFHFSLPFPAKTAREETRIKPSLVQTAFNEGGSGEIGQQTNSHRIPLVSEMLSGRSRRERRNLLRQ
jgi:hypothetical protein